MKKIVVVLVSFVVAILVIGGNAFAQDKTSKASIPDPSLGPEWKLALRGLGGSTLYLNTKMTHSSKDIVEVRTLYVPRGELRRTMVNGLKKRFLSEGKDPNNAERLWYFIQLDKINCKTNQNATLEFDIYSFEKTVLLSHSFQHEKWDYIIPGSADEVIEKYACKSEAFIPEPSLSSRWKHVSNDPDWSTIYVDKEGITPLPKGIVKVWVLWVPRGEIRRKLVNDLKKDLLSEGKDPNKAERLWYFNQLEKINCKKHKSAILEVDAYSFKQVPLDSHSFQHEEWDRIIPGSIGEDIERYVCKEHKEKK